MSVLLLAVILSVVSTLAYASGAVVQQRIAASAGPLPLRLLGDPAWWVAIGLNCIGGFLHILALRFGPLTLVQPLGALTLVFALLLSARRPGHPVSRTEWRGAALTMWGLAGLLALTVTAAPDDVLDSTAALGVGAAAVAAAAALALTTGRAGPTLRALALAAASGIVSGASSALTQTVMLRLPVEGATVLVGPVSLVVAAFAVTGFLLAQASYRGGLGAPLAVLTITNPLAAATIGIALLGERFTAGAPGAAAAACAAVLTCVGVVLLSRPGPRAAAVEPSLAGVGEPAD